MKNKIISCAAGICLCVSLISGCAEPEPVETVSPETAFSQPASATAVPAETPVEDYSYEDGETYDSGSGIIITASEPMLVNTVRDYGVALRDDDNSIYLIQKWHVINQSGDDISASSVIKTQTEYKEKIYSNVQYFFDNNILLYLNPSIQAGTECDLYSMLTIPYEAVCADPETNEPAAPLEFITTIGTDRYRFSSDRIADYHSLQILVCEIAGALPAHISAFNSALEHTWGTGMDYHPEQTLRDMETLGADLHKTFSGWLSGLDSERVNAGKYEDGFNNLYEVLSAYDSIFSMLGDNTSHSEGGYEQLLPALRADTSAAYEKAHAAFPLINANMPFAEFKFM